jgi:hypothetical protein
MVLDVAGDISLVLSIVTLFLLILGLPLTKELKSAENFRRHGYLTIAALIVETILIFTVMLPTFVDEFDSVLALYPIYAVNTWLHVVLGVFAEAAGFLFVVMWLSAFSKMGCVRFRKFMTPTFAVWLIAVFTGAVIHLLEML